MYLIATQEYLTCSSEDGKYSTCPIFTGFISSIQNVIKDISAPGHCIEGTDYGISDNYIWVDNGCQGTFTVDVQEPGKFVMQLV